jgi:hypothetical protein
MQTNKPKWIVYDRSEKLWESIASDVFTFGGLTFCIWFSKIMGGGFWVVFTVAFFLLWCICKLPWQPAKRTTKIRTKAEAKAWAKSLPDDEGEK